MPITESKPITIHALSYSHLVVVSSNHNHGVTTSKAERCHSLRLSHLCSFIDKDMSKEIFLKEASQVWSCKAGGHKKQAILLRVSSDMPLDTPSIPIVLIQITVAVAVVWRSNQECIDSIDIPTLLQTEECFEEGISRYALLSAYQDADKRGGLLEKESYGDRKDSSLTCAKGPSYEHGWT